MQALNTTLLNSLRFIQTSKFHSFYTTFTNSYSSKLIRNVTFPDLTNLSSNQAFIETRDEIF